MPTFKHEEKQKLLAHPDKFSAKRFFISFSQIASLVFVMLFIFLSGIAFAGKPVGKPHRKDKSPPTTPVVEDEGQYTNFSSQLYASWSSRDPQSGISEYKYSIGTEVGLANVVDWVSTGIEPEVTAMGLSLVNGQVYYFNVMAKNGVNLWSEDGYSDGITVLIQAPPQIIFLEPENNSTFTEGDPIDIVIQAQGSPPLEYRYSVDGGVIQDWTLSNTYSWQTQAGDVRQKTFTVDVRDMYQAAASQDTDVFIFRKPPEPE